MLSKKTDRMMSIIMSKQLIKRIREIGKKEQRLFAPMVRVLLEEALAARATKG
jgi:hypothetical protein